MDDNHDRVRSGTCPSSSSDRQTVDTWRRRRDRACRCGCAVGCQSRRSARDRQTTQRTSNIDSTRKVLSTRQRKNVSRRRNSSVEANVGGSSANSEVAYVYSYRQRVRSGPSGCSRSQCGTMQTRTRRYDSACRSSSAISCESDRSTADSQTGTNTSNIHNPSEVLSAGQRQHVSRRRNSSVETDIVRCSRHSKVSNMDSDDCRVGDSRTTTRPTQSNRIDT